MKLSDIDLSVMEKDQVIKTLKRFKAQYSPQVFELELEKSLQAMGDLYGKYAANALRKMVAEL